MPVEVNPIFAYHGTDVQFPEFSDKKAQQRDEGWLGKGHYFSTDANVARANKYVAETELNVKNPFILHLPNFGTDKRTLIRETLKLPKDASSEDITKKLKSLGYDGVSLDYSPTGYNAKEILAFHGKQTKIKSWKDVPKTSFNAHLHKK
jgi:ADP-Ribosyltransferase in polyvalent proteins